MAEASGCSLLRSRAAATRRSSCSGAPSAATTSVTRGTPSVMVPVLSSTTVPTEQAVSSDSALLMRMPCAAPRPVPTMMAVGVARPSAQGQLMTSTETACVSAVAKSREMMVQTMNVMAAMPITMGTNTPATLSARRSMGAFDPVASSTRRMMPASVVSSPTAVASMANHPRVETVAPVTCEPTVFSTGIGSPVMALSSTDAAPSTTMPSTGMDSPARTMTRSPTRTCSVGMVCSTPSRTTVAVLGARSMSAVMAPVVRPLARASKNLPSVMRVRIMPAESK